MDLDWFSAIWSDECQFNLFGNADGRVYVKWRIREEMLPECLLQIVKFGGGNVIVWRCIPCDGVATLLFILVFSFASNRLLLWNNGIEHCHP